MYPFNDGMSMISVKWAITSELIEFRDDPQNNAENIKCVCLVNSDKNGTLLHFPCR